MSETEKVIQSYIDGLIDTLGEGKRGITIPSILKALREIQDVARKEIKLK